MSTLTCIGKDGIERIFQTHIREEFNGEIRLLVSDTVELVDDYFEVVLRPQSQTLLRVVSINHHGLARYTHKGIPAAVLTYATQHWGCRVESSPAMTDDRKDRRSPDATRMWEGMVARGEAERYADRDQFFIDPPSETGTALSAVRNGGGLRYA